MRSLVPHPADKRDRYDTLEALRDFHVTRLEWVYNLDLEFVKKVRNLGVSVGGAINPVAALVGTDEEKRKIRLAAARNLNGLPSRAPWMRSWNPATFWLCINNPATRQILDAHLEKLVRLGVSSIQFDDPGGNFQSLAWGACYCPYCIQKFSRYLSKLDGPEATDVPRNLDYDSYLQNKDQTTPQAAGLRRLYSEFQRNSTIAFHREWQRILKRMTKRRISLSSNNGAASLEGAYAPFDFWIGELSVSSATPAKLHVLSLRVRDAGKRQVLTMPLEKNPAAAPNWIPLARRTLATAYATGMLMEAPWDTYLPSPNAKRYFGNPRDFADLYGMIRACAPYLDGYEEAGAQGAGLAGEWDTGSPVSVLEPTCGMYAFTRVKPSDRNAPIVVHLVSWSGVSAPVTLKANAMGLFGGRLLQATVITPAPYQRAAHQAAAQFKNFGPLIQSSRIPVNSDGALSIPVPTPWSIVVFQLAE